MKENLIGVQTKENEMNKFDEGKVCVSFDPKEYFGAFVCEGQRIEFEGNLVFSRTMRDGKELYFVSFTNGNGEEAIAGFERKYVRLIKEECGYCLDTKIVHYDFTETKCPYCKKENE